MGRNSGLKFLRRPAVSNYWFQLNQGNRSQADVVIVGSTTLTTDCANTALGPLCLITLPTHLESSDPYAVISPVVQHGLGYTVARASGERPPTMGTRRNTTTADNG